MQEQPQDEYIKALTRTTRETDARVGALVRPLSDAQLHWHPSDGGWSVGDVLEHLCIVYDSYDTQLRALIDDSGAPGADATAAWAATLAGRMMVKSFMSDRKLPAPKMFRPAREPRPDVLDEFLNRERDLLERLQRAHVIDLRHTRLVSPVSRLVRINLGDALGIIVHHSRRHLKQMERVRARVGFPAS